MTDEENINRPKKLNKKIIIPIIFVAVIIIFVNFIAPTVIKNNLINNDTSDYPYKEFFITNYDEIRYNFMSHGLELQAAMYTHAIDESDGLFIDTMYIAPEKEENLILISTGVHGIEAYIGATMLEVFFAEIMPTISLETTGVAVVSNVNPYGVKYGRRFNENNVDLNRNFIYNWNEFDLANNQYYPEVVGFLEPTQQIGNIAVHDINFFSKLIYQAIFNGVDTVTNALLSGQYEYENGVYYGGNNDEKSTQYLKEVFDTIANSNYKNIIYIDIHSGYGSRYDMTIFNSGFDPMTEAEAVEAYNYSNIIAHDSPEFYLTTGDTTEYFYKTISDNQELYATAFEFGTLGDSLIDSIFSLKYTVEENQNNKNPTTNKTSQEIIALRYMEMFFPSEIEWRKVAVDSFKEAMFGVLEYKIK